MLFSFIDIDMAKLIEMDERVGIFEQMEDDVGPVILINKFSVDPDEFDQFIKGWAAEAKKFKEQPGFISTQLHKGIGGRGTFVNSGQIVFLSAQYNSLSSPIQETCSAWDLCRLILLQISICCCQRNIHKLAIHVKHCQSL